MTAQEENIPLICMVDGRTLLKIDAEGFVYMNDQVVGREPRLPECFPLYQATSIIAPKESTNPYIDEVFDMRICNVISEILNKEVKEIRLSDCPHISKLDKRKNIGYKSTQDYEVAMRKYELKDKLI